MRRRHKILFALAVLIIALTASAGWYWRSHSMRVVQSFDINDPASGPGVLIASQGSDFKDEIVAGLASHLRPLPVHTRVIDVSLLPEVNEEQWAAIVILHTWEMGQPPEPVATFVANARQRHKIVDLATSGDGTQKIEGVDVISTASRMADVAPRTADLIARVDRLIATAEH